MTEKLQQFLSGLNIAKWLGFSVSEKEGALRYALSFDEQHIGNPAIRALHGGAIATFLEVAAQCELINALPENATIRTVNLDIDYLASSRAQDMFGRARITRLGRRIAFVEAEGWQESKERSVARARFRIRIDKARSA